MPSSSENPRSVVHILQGLSRGGAARATVHAARESSEQEGFEHHIVSLTAADRTALEWARDAGISVSDRPEESTLARILADADLVQINFWNSPELYSFVRGSWPPMRVLLWIRVVGNTMPHVLVPQWIDFADFVVAGCPRTAQLSVMRDGSLAGKPISMVWPGADFRRLARLQPKGHEGFRVGYIGAVDWAKIHPRFIDLHLRAKIETARFVICGVGDALGPLQRETSAGPEGYRFSWRGHVEDIATVLGELDVFGYPLCEETSASAEVVLQEAMFAGVPPVLFPRGGTGDVVEHGRTGLVVRTDEEYVQALQFLARHPDERRRLGANARAYAQEHFGAEQTATGLNAAYRELCQQPKRLRTWPSPEAATGAALFLESLGSFAAPLAPALFGATPEKIRAAESLIRGAPAVATAPSGGGILHYRAAFRDDPHLRIWAGLVLLEAGRPALALAEFTAAQKLGISADRVAAYQEEARQALSLVRRDFPGE